MVSIGLGIGFGLARKLASFNPLAVPGITFGFEARNQGVANTATTSAITDESGCGRNLSGESATTFTYDATTKSFYKTTNKTCFGDIVTGGFRGSAGTVIVMAQLLSGTGALCSFVSSSANVGITGNTALVYNVNQAGAAQTAGGAYNLTSPFMMALRIADAANASIQINGEAKTTFDPHNAYSSNTFFRIGSINGTTAGTLARYFAVYTFDRALTDDEVAKFYSHFQKNFT